MKHVFILVAMVTVLVGCKTYSPAPIDWSAEWETWQSVGTNQVVLSRESVRALALIGNPELAMLRLKCSISSNAVLQSGWWDDPEISFDGLRILADGAEFPWVLGAAVTLTVPVSGVKGLEKKMVQAYSEADMWTLRAAESLAMAEAEVLLIRLWMANEHVGFAKEITRIVEKCHAILKKLADVGELSEMSQLHDMRQRLAEAKVSQRNTEMARTIAAEELLAFLGFPPKTSWAMSIDQRYYSDLNFDEAEISPETLTRHPRVMAKLAKLNVSEAELKLEIRRQYPDLVIDPTLGREDGENRAGLVAGISLPLWNRNRAAIAQAEGERAISREDVIQEWKALVQEYAIALEVYRNAKEAETVSYRDYMDEMVTHADAELVSSPFETLFQAGELSAVDVLEAGQRHMMAESALIEAMQAFYEAVVRLSVIVKVDN